MIKLDLLPQVKIEQINDENGRHYKLHNSDIKYTSITTLLGKTADKTYLDNWRKRIGHEAADDITKTAANKGTSIHNLVEHYLKDKPLPLFNSLQEKLRFLSLQKYLDDEISILKGSEYMLYSPKMKVAGTCDLFYISNKNELVIGDLKSSRKRKRVAWIEDYYLQVTAYAVMIAELYHIYADIGKIIMTVESTIDEDIPEIPEPEIFKFKIADYLEKLYYRISKYKG
jgi:genome maintenance exonuclease 1